MRHLRRVRTFLQQFRAHVTRLPTPSPQAKFTHSTVRDGCRTQVVMVRNGNVRKSRQGTQPSRDDHSMALGRRAVLQISCAAVHYLVLCIMHLLLCAYRAADGLHHRAHVLDLGRQPQVAHLPRHRREPRREPRNFYQSRTCPATHPHPPPPAAIPSRAPAAAAGPRTPGMAQLGSNRPCRQQG